MVHLNFLFRFTFLIIWVVLGFLALLLMSPLRMSNIKKKVINYWSKILLFINPSSSYMQRGKKRTT